MNKSEFRNHHQQRSNRNGMMRYNIGLMLRLILGTESRVRRFMSGEMAMNSQCGGLRRKSKNSIRIVWNDVTIFIHKQNKAK